MRIKTRKTFLLESYLHNNEMHWRKLTRNWLEVCESDKKNSFYSYSFVVDPQNAKSIDSISKALFIVCLDEAVPLNKSDEKNIASHQLIHGGGSTQNSANRWFNKTIQFIINENGLNGLNYEHSPAEGQPIAVLADYINTQVL